MTREGEGGDDDDNDEVAGGPRSGLKYLSLQIILNQNMFTSPASGTLGI